MTIEQLNKIPAIQNVDLTNKKVIVRLDLNVPAKDGKITSYERINATKKTLDYLIESGCKIIILSHFSRIKTKEDILSGKKSLKIVVPALQKMFPKMQIIFVKNSYDKKLPSMVRRLKPHQILLLENTRYNDVSRTSGQTKKLESGNDSKLGKFWASLANVFVNDAFATIHRGHASNAGISKYIKKSCIGFLIQEELENIVNFNKYSTKPIVSIVGGAKIADKIILLEQLMQISDKVLIGGGMANTFLAALGINVGGSLIEKEMFSEAKRLYKTYKHKIVLPTDALVAPRFANVEPKVVAYDKIKPGYMSLDIGPETLKQFLKVISLAQTIFWNGPTGVFELSHYSHSSKEIALAIAKQTKDESAFSLIGGGDTAAAATKFAKKYNFSWVSTGGGATLAVIQGDKLPGLIAEKK